MTGGVRGTGAERVRWTQLARRSVGNRKECLHDYAGFPDRNEARAERPGE